MKKIIGFCIVVIFLFSGLASASLVDGLVAYYSFSGNANDDSGNGNHGTVNNAILTSDRHGTSNSAYYFDGVNDSIRVSDSPELDIINQITMAAWIAPSQQKTQHIIRKGAHVNGSYAAPYGLSLSGTGDLIFSLRPNLNFTQVRRHGYNLNEWTFLLGTYDGSMMSLYVNGLLEASTSVAGLLTANDLPLLIGTRLNLPADTFLGGLDEIRLYNRALDNSEIQDLYSSNTPVPEPSTIFLLGGSLICLQAFRKIDMKKRMRK